MIISSGELGARPSVESEKKKCVGSWKGVVELK